MSRLYLPAIGEDFRCTEQAILRIAVT